MGEGPETPNTYCTHVRMALKLETDPRCLAHNRKEDLEILPLEPISDSIGDLILAEVSINIAEILLSPPSDTTPESFYLKIETFVVGVYGCNLDSNVLSKGHKQISIDLLQQIANMKGCINRPRRLEFLMRQAS